MALFGVVYQLIFLLSIDKVVFFSWTQVVNDTVYSSFLAILLYIWVQLWDLLKMIIRNRRLRWIMRFLISMCLVFLAVLFISVSYFYIFMILALFVWIWIWFLKKDPLVNWSFIIAIILLMISFVYSDPYRYDKMVIKNIHAFSWEYGIKYMNDGYIFFYKGKIKETDNITIKIIPRTDDNLNEMYISTDIVDLSPFNTIKTLRNSLCTDCVNTFKKCVGYVYQKLLTWKILDPNQQMIGKKISSV